MSATAANDPKPKKRRSKREDETPEEKAARRARRRHRKFQGAANATAGGEQELELPTYFKLISEKEFSFYNGVAHTTRKELRKNSGRPRGTAISVKERPKTSEI